MTYRTHNTCPRVLRSLRSLRPCRAVWGVIRRFVRSFRPAGHKSPNPVMRPVFRRVCCRLTEAGQSAVAFRAARPRLPAVRAAFAGFPVVAFPLCSFRHSRFFHPQTPQSPVSRRFDQRFFLHRSGCESSSHNLFYFRASGTRCRSVFPMRCMKIHTSSHTKYQGCDKQNANGFQSGKKIYRHLACRR